MSLNEVKKGYPSRSRLEKMKEMFKTNEKEIRHMFCPEPDFTNKKETAERVRVVGCRKSGSPIVKRMSDGKIFGGEHEC